MKNPNPVLLNELELEIISTIKYIHSCLEVGMIPEQNLNIVKDKFVPKITKSMTTTETGRRLKSLENAASEMVQKYIDAHTTKAQEEL